ncbi:hypothetical protein V5T82_05265 [Magnetovibrio sp. PR-2]|uniref:hypothetical protein n=1 Tax=Magnetovibrio sp. PR-2 TaxID=3120356 RepID=UPI002FCE5C3A
MKLGLWHEGVTGEAAEDEAAFEEYCAAMIRFIKKAKIKRSFFSLIDPGIDSGAANYTQWMKTYWLDKLPEDCEAGIVAAIRPKYKWTWDTNVAPKGADNIQQCFKFISENLNSGSGKKVTCVAFDGEGMGEYASTKGVENIATAWDQYFPDLKGKYDFGWAKMTPPVKSGTIELGTVYPELYWIGENKEVGCTDYRKTPTQCGSGTLYHKYVNQPQAMYDNVFKAYFEEKKTYFKAAGAWPMFSVEHFTDKNCPQATYDPGGFCGTFDGFGVWEWDAFYKFLELVSTTIDKEEIMIYEWQFIPTSWIPEA